MCIKQIPTHFQNVNLDCKLLVLKWIYELLKHADSASYLNIVLLSQEMINIVNSLVYVGLKHNEILLFDGIAKILNVVLGNSAFCQSKVILCLHYNENYILINHFILITASFNF